MTEYKKSPPRLPFADGTPTDGNGIPLTAEHYLAIIITYLNTFEGIIRVEDVNRPTRFPFQFEDIEYLVRKAWDLIPDQSQKEYCNCVGCLIRIRNGEGWCTECQSKINSAR